MEETIEVKEKLEVTKSVTSKRCSSKDVRIKDIKRALDGLDKQEIKI